MSFSYPKRRIPTRAKLSDGSVVFSGEELVNFALKWRHWGGGTPADIFVEFGLRPAEYFRRLQQHLDRPAASKLSPAVTEQLDRICSARITALEHR